MVIQLLTNSHKYQPSFKCYMLKTGKDACLPGTYVLKFGGTQICEIIKYSTDKLVSNYGERNKEKGLWPLSEWVIYGPPLLRKPGRFER